MYHRNWKSPIHILFTVLFIICVKKIAITWQIKIFRIVYWVLYIFKPPGTSILTSPLLMFLQDLKFLAWSEAWQSLGTWLGTIEFRYNPLNECLHWIRSERTEPSLIFTWALEQRVTLRSTLSHLWVYELKAYMCLKTSWNSFLMLWRPTWALIWLNGKLSSCWVCAEAGTTLPVVCDILR